MNRHKTLFESYEAVLTAGISVFGLFMSAYLISCIFRISVLIRAILLIPGAVCLILLIVFKIRLNYQADKYRKLCTSFINGDIYQDFINEIGGLFPGMDDSILRLDDLIDRQEILSLSQKQAEFLALQNQINPHFLYNTLDAIRGDAIVAGLDNVAAITQALSTFFRYTITDAQNLVTIREELASVDHYFVIQKYRFGDKLSMEIDLVDDRESLLQMQCPKLFLQPIIENAIFHGLERSSANGQITIRMEIIDHELHVDVIDNGVGIPEDTLSELNQSLSRVSVGAITEDHSPQHSGIALKNVCRRIKLLFGDQYGIHLSSVRGMGTRVEITLPAAQKRRANED